MVNFHETTSHRPFSLATCCTHVIAVPYFIGQLTPTYMHVQGSQLITQLRRPSTFPVKMTSRYLSTNPFFPDMLFQNNQTESLVCRIWGPKMYIKTSVTCCPGHLFSDGKYCRLHHLFSGGGYIAILHY